MWSWVLRLRPPVWGMCIAFALLLAAGRPGEAAAPTLDLDRAQVDTQASPTWSDTVDATALPMDFLSDEARPLSIDQVEGDSDRSRFRPWNDRDATMPFLSGWLRFSIRSGTQQKRWLLIAPLDYDEADLYVHDARGGYVLTRLGMLVPANKRSYHLLGYPVTPIDAGMANGKPVYVHFVRRGFALPASLWVATESAALTANRNMAQADFVWIGIYLAVAISNLLLFAYLRDRAFLLYSGVSLTLTLDILLADARAWNLLWPWASVSFQPFFNLTNDLYLLGLLLFARSFLGLKSRAPRLDVAVLVLGGVSLCLSFFNPIDLWLGFTGGMLMALTLLGAGIVMICRGDAAARFYVIAFAGYVAGITLNDWSLLNVSFAGFLNRLPWPLSAPGYLGLAWDGLFLTFALGDRVQSAKNDAFNALAEREGALRQLADAQQQTLDRVNAQNTSMERFVPHAFLEHLGKTSIEELRLGDHTLREMTLLFSDIRSFTTLAESMSPQDTFDFLNSYLGHVGPIVRRHNGFIDKYIGDAIMALFANSAGDAVDAAITLQLEVGRYNQSRARAGYRAIAIGVGLHRGLLALGTIGETERIETTVIADAVNVASRMEGLTKLLGARIIASRAVVDNLDERARYRMRSLGRVQVVGATHDVEIFEFFDADPPELILLKLQSLDAFAEGVAAYAEGSFASAKALFARICEDAPADRAAAYFARRSEELTSTVPSDAWDGVERLEMK